jgi:hypothetical protein
VAKVSKNERPRKLYSSSSEQRKQMHHHTDATSVGVKGHIRIYIFLVQGLNVLSTAEARSKASGMHSQYQKEPGI